MKEGKTIDNYPLDSRSDFKSSQILRQSLRNVTKINDLRKTGSVALLFLAPWRQLHSGSEKILL